MSTDELDNAVAFANAIEHSGDPRACFVQAKAACRTLAREIERLQAIVATLPKDAEGNAVYPGRELVSTWYGTNIQQPRTVCQIWADGWTLGGSSKYRHDDTSRLCYGSIEAAEQARQPCLTANA